MKSIKYTREEFMNKFTGASTLEWDAYNIGFLHGQMDEGTKQLNKLKEKLEDVNGRAKYFKSGPAKDS